MNSAIHKKFFLAILAFAAASCTPHVNPIATNEILGPHDQGANRLLDASERRTVINVMRDSFRGPHDDAARPAVDGLRFSDVQRAAVTAAAEVNLAVLSVSKLEDSNADAPAKTTRIVLIGLTDQEGELLVREVAAPKIYDATLQIGAFGHHKTQEQAFLEAFNRAMIAWGKAPGWPAPLNE